ncbi:hypothetical protein HYV86_03915 [Candidatus Woesearchaeota archaeon]|nr:hypothetical protein [Candidatus Woesearchaeota archaeon]
MYHLQSTEDNAKPNLETLTHASGTKIMNAVADGHFYQCGFVMHTRLEAEGWDHTDLIQGRLCSVSFSENENAFFLDFEAQHTGEEALYRDILRLPLQRSRFSIIAPQTSNSGLYIVCGSTYKLLLAMNVNGSSILR